MHPQLIHNTESSNQEKLERARNGPSRGGWWELTSTCLCLHKRGLDISAVAAPQTQGSDPAKRKTYWSLFALMAGSLAFQVALRRWLGSAITPLTDQSTNLLWRGTHDGLTWFCNETKRCAPLEIANRFTFVHISKCAGGSWIRLGNQILPHFQPRHESGQEFTVRGTNRLWPDADHRLILLRSPRSHLWSLYAHCHYSKWGRARTKGRSFPRGGEGVDDGGDNDTVAFGLWLLHFLNHTDGRPAGLDAYNCYHPVNFQSRFLTAEKTKNEGAVPTTIEPKLNESIASYWTFDFVGLVDFNHESNCLLYHRLSLKKTEGGGGNNTDDVWTRAREVKQMLARDCVCPRPQVASEVHVVHRKDGHRSSMLGLPMQLYDMMDRIAATDLEVYKVALVQILNEIALMEFQLNRRVLCDEALRRLSPELEYVVRQNITTLYHELHQGTGLV